MVLSRHYNMIVIKITSVFTIARWCYTFLHSKAAARLLLLSQVINSICKNCSILIFYSISNFCCGKPVFSLEDTLGIHNIIMNCTVSIYYSVYLFFTNPLFFEGM